MTPDRAAVRRPTILDVAARAGVSKSAVSLALRGSAGIGDETRARILACAEEIGYRSNRLARALVEGRSALVGVVLNDLSNPYHTEIVAGIEDGATAMGATTLLTHGQRDPHRTELQVDMLLGLNVEGLVLVGSRIPVAALERLGRTLPTIVIGRLEAPVPGVDTIANDDQAGAELAVRHLAALGHTHIAHVSASLRPAARSRREAYLSTMERLGLGPHATVHARERVDGEDEDLDAVARRAVTDPRTTAVFASNDVAALAVMDAASASGASLPDDLSVVGYDNSTISRIVRPRLTSVDQPRPLMGTLAAEMLAERLAGRTTDRHEVLLPTLVVRGSTAAPRSAGPRSGGPSGRDGQALPADAGMADPSDGWTTTKPGP
ncbi:LacI family DNA-binding transcriptional regulator [Sanguibacter sp. 25GB23B1]|uniref:LacI family DNA-binding transcriptional regulator n=1 Tax=unclassified Sanguibacter TaxID=2645534 RepID=UPI0032AF5E7E